MFIRTRSLSNAFRQLTVYVRINIISELFRPVEKKSNSLISNCIAAMMLSSFCIILTKQLTSSVTRPFDSSPALHHKRSIVTMRLSILHCYRDMAPQRRWGYEFDLLGSRDVIGHVTIRLPVVNFLWVVYSDNASIWHSYGDMAPQILDAQTWTLKKRWKKGKRMWKEKEKRKGIGKGKKEVEKERKGKGKEEGKRIEKGKGKWKGKEKRKGKARWKKDSLRKVRRTDTRTLRWFYTLSNAIHSIGQTIKVASLYSWATLYTLRTRQLRTSWRLSVTEDINVR